MTFGGIDAGLKGGIALITNGILHLWPTPLIGGQEYDIQEMKNLLIHSTQAGPVFFTLEKQMALPGQGLSSTFRTGQGFGVWTGLLAGLNIPYQITPAIKWQKDLFVGLSKRLDTKVQSEIVAKRIFPSAVFLRSERSKKVADGMTDAACIAEFSRRTYRNNQPEENTGTPLFPQKDTVC